MCIRDRGIKNVVLHLITDGRDSAPKAAHTYVDDIEARLKQLQIGSVAVSYTHLDVYKRQCWYRRWKRSEPG